MLAQKFSKTFDIGDGREVTIETGRLARQADGAVTVKIGNCFLLATVCATEKPKEGQDFFPLSVDYMEKFSSARVGFILNWPLIREIRTSDITSWIGTVETANAAEAAKHAIASGIIWSSLEIRVTITCTSHK